MKQALGFFLILFFYFAFINKVAGIYIADLYFTNSKVLLEDKDFDASLTEINKAVGINKQEPAYLRQKARVLLAQRVLAPDDSEKEKLGAKAVNTLYRAQKLNPKNLATLRNIIPLYTILADDEEEILESTRNYYSHLKNTYPNDLGIFIDIAKSEKELALSEDFQISKVVITKLRPEILDWHEVFYGN